MSEPFTADAASRVEEPATQEWPAADVGAGGQLEDVRAEHVEIVQGGAQRIDAHSVSIEQGGAGLVRASEVSVHQGGIGLVRADSVELRETSSAVAVAAREANIGAGSNIVFLLARTVRGDVQPLLDWRAAAAFGAAFAVVTALLRRR